LENKVRHEEKRAVTKPRESEYFAISLQQFSIARQILLALYGTRTERLELLDFACGYGRLLRLLGALVPMQKTWASDLQADAVAFVAENFGVHGVASNADPAQFEPGRRFDVIWVASLFSHLPEALFRAWLWRLLDLLAPGGVLCFSVRDQSQLPPGVVLPAAGLLYATQSENADLDPSIYGTAYASETFVRAALARIAPDLPCVRLPRALANEQDMYVVARDAERDLSALNSVRRGPWGWVDVRQMGADGVLDLQGWAASLDDGEVECVQIIVDGICTDLRTGIARPDVVAAFNDPRMSNAGWRHRVELPAGTATVTLEVDALSKRGERTLLYAGTLSPKVDRTAQTAC